MHTTTLSLVSDEGRGGELAFDIIQSVNSTFIVQGPLQEVSDNTCTKCSLLTLALVLPMTFTCIACHVNHCLRKAQ